MPLAEAASKVEERLRLPAETFGRPVLVLISGLPGSGKSYFARRLADRVRAVVIETDFVRKTIYSKPRYTARESLFVYRVSHYLIKRLLERGYRVIFDATNLLERKREELYHIAEQAEAKLVIVRVVAPEDVIRQRLESRQLQRSPEDLSEATWAVYERMKKTEEPIRRSHLVVDTSRDLAGPLDKVSREVRN
ncbi:MAG: AAA family ATPase [Chloroflexota bacterium]